MGDTERVAEPVGPEDATLTGGLLASRRRTSATETLPHVLEHLREDGRVENFRRAAAGDTDYERQGRPSCDADLYKWLEGACYVLAETGDEELAGTIDELVGTIAAAQREDGYLNTYFDLEEGERWTNLGMMHELYAAGHLIEAAVAHREATGTDDLLEVARAYADHIDETFGPDGVDGYPGHEEIELALVRLSRETGERRYLELASYFVDERGREDSRFRWEMHNHDQIAGGSGSVYERLYADDDGEYEGTYAQDHAPVREQETMEGHAVKATYLYSAVTDLAMETGDGSLAAAVERLWENMRTRRMYVTGGIGSQSDNEGFTEDYDLPNHDAYAETCASISNVMWNHRLFQLTGEGRFLDVLERALYNGVLAGVSLDGRRFFYTNPLAADGDHDRSTWFDRCPCCPTNVVRFLPAVERYLYATGEDTLYATLYAASETTATVGGDEVTVTQATDYPWDGTVEFEIGVDGPASFALALRIPEWCREWSLAVDGEPVAATPEDGFVAVDRTWRDGDAVTLELSMPAERVVAHPEVRNDAGKAAIRRGPIVYCLEGVDNADNLDRIELDEPAPDVEHDPGLLSGVTTVETPATADSLEGWDGALYRPADETTEEGTTVTAVPYYAWNNRGADEMRVWLRSA